MLCYAFCFAPKERCLKDYEKKETFHFSYLTWTSFSAVCPLIQKLNRSHTSVHNTFLYLSQTGRPCFAVRAESRRVIEYVSPEPAHLFLGPLQNDRSYCNFFLFFILFSANNYLTSRLHQQFRIWSLRTVYCLPCSGTYKTEYYAISPFFAFVEYRCCCFGCSAGFGGLARFSPSVNWNRQTSCRLYNSNDAFFLYYYFRWTKSYALFGE